MDKMTKEKWDAFSGREKREYIWDYFKVHIIVTAVVLVLLGMFIGQLVTYREPYLDVIMVNSRTDSQGQQGFHDFLQKQELEVFENCIALLKNFYIDAEDSTQIYESMQDLESLYAVTAAGKQDLLFDTEVFIGQCAKGGTLLDLSTVLTPQELERYAEHLVYTTEDDTCEAYPCAVRVKNNAWIRDNGYYYDKGAMAIMESTDDLELSVAFLRYYLSCFE